jgi:ubiquinone/menaquinone biosynthesis C-methylase UbiE/glycosyltransferase involved in cell wall biosynthesis
MPGRSEDADKVRVSVLVLTFNEEANVAACLRSVSWAAEVLLVDSGSNDRTVAIATDLGAAVYGHPFEGYAAQRNWALDNLPFSHDWILMLDADELIPPALADEIAQVIADNRQDTAGYYIKRRFFFLGHHLKRGGLDASWLLRLFRRGRARVEARPLNEHVILEGNSGYLSQPFDHQDQRPFSDWIAKHNRYTNLEVEEYLQEKLRGGYQGTIEARFWGNEPERNRWIKQKLWNRLPLLVRPFLFFFRNYFLKGGFLDGVPGFIYQVLWSFWVRFLTDVKIIERQSRQSGAKENKKPVDLKVGATSELTREERIVAPTANDVRALFNREARFWHGKYGPRGKLDSRMEQFTAWLSELCPAPSNILDLGCGTGEIAAAIDQRGYHVTACDFAEEMLAVARSNYTETPVKWVGLEPDWEVLPFEDGSFDGIVASSVFEYLDDVPSVAAELARVLRPEGILLLTVPNPGHLARKLEAWLQSMPWVHSLLSALRRVQRIDSYAAYLRLSRNRFEGPRWQSILSAVDFAPMDKRDFSREAWHDQANAPLVLLAVKRVAPGGSGHFGPEAAIGHPVVK